MQYEGKHVFLRMLELKISVRKPLRAANRPGSARTVPESGPCPVRPGFHYICPGNDQNLTPPPKKIGIDHLQAKFNKCTRKRSPRENS